MDFKDTPEELAFRVEVRAFLDANASLQADDVPVADLRAVTDEDVMQAKAWQAKKADAGFAAISLPQPYGGRGASPMMQAIFNQEEAKYATAPNVFRIGLGMCIPTLIAYAAPEHVSRFVTPALRGAEIWCQLFSEPGAGSDLAAVRTRAVRSGDEWVVNGQKIWTSGAHFSDWGLVMCRTNPDAPKHAGLTVFFINMKSPGIEVRRIHQMSGASHFNEVFFTDVRVSDAQRLGAVDAGWRVSLTTLMNERLTLASRGSRPHSLDLMNLAKGLRLNGSPAIEDTGLRAKVAEWWVREQGLLLTHYRNLTALSRGRAPGPESSIGKMISASMSQEIASYGLDLVGAAGAVTNAGLPFHTNVFQDAYLASPGMRIGGGSDEILRNVIAERVLEMPADVRADKVTPFNQIKA